MKLDIVGSVVLKFSRRDCRCVKYFSTCICPQVNVSAVAVPYRCWMFHDMLSLLSSCTVMKHLFQCHELSIIGSNDANMKPW